MKRHHYIVLLMSFASFALAIWIVSRPAPDREEWRFEIPPSEPWTNAMFQIRPAVGLKSGRASRVKTNSGERAYPAEVATLPPIGFVQWGSEKNKTPSNFSGGVESRHTAFQGVPAKPDLLNPRPVSGRMGKQCARLDSRSSARPAEFISLLNAIESVESGGNALARGRAGERGSFQFTAAAWRQAGLLIYGSSTKIPHAYATNRAVAYLVASNHVSWLHRQLSSALHTNPTTVQLYAAWNLGHAGFKRRGFDLRRCPAITRDAAERVNNLYFEP